MLTFFILFISYFHHAIDCPNFKAPKIMAQDAKTSCAILVEKCIFLSKNLENWNKYITFAA